MDTNKSFGLIFSKRTNAFQKTTSAAIFGSDSDEESSPKRPIIPQIKKPPPKQVKTEKSEDPSIYEYDAVYDNMKAEKAAASAPKTTKPSRYIESLLKAADKRKKEDERRMERKVHKERVKEGDQFKEKESFVTASYKKKMQELEEEEERERRENALNDMMDVTKQKDLSGFYRHFLKQSVGEEKVPVFGERNVAAVKEEVESEPEENPPVKSKLDRPTEQEEKVSVVPYVDNDDRDSDWSMSSEEEDISTKKGPTSKSEQTEGDVLQKSEVKFTSHKRKVSSKNIRKPVEDEERIESTKESSPLQSSAAEKTLSPLRSAKRSRTKSVSEEESDSASESDTSKKKKVDCASSESDSERVDSSKTKDKDSVTPEIKRNIYEKRTVGDVFAAAQARYFQRMAAKG